MCVRNATGERMSKSPVTTKLLSFFAASFSWLRSIRIRSVAPAAPSVRLLTTVTPPSHCRRLQPGSTSTVELLNDVVLGHSVVAPVARIGPVSVLLLNVEVPNTTTPPPVTVRPMSSSVDSGSASTFWLM